MLTQIAIHGSGVAAIALAGIGLASKSDRVLRDAAVAAAILWAVNNAALGAYGAAGVFCVTAVRQWMALYLQDRKASMKHAAFAVFASINVAVTWYTWDGVHSLYSLAGAVSANAAVFYLRGFSLRVAMATVPFFWVAHAVHYDAGWQLAANLLLIGTAAYGAWKTRPMKSSHTALAQGLNARAQP